MTTLGPGPSALAAWTLTAAVTRPASPAGLQARRVVDRVVLGASGTEGCDGTR